MKSFSFKNSQIGSFSQLEQELNSFFDNQIVDVNQLADFLKVSPKTIYKKVRLGEIPHKKIGSKIRFLGSELKEWWNGGY